MGSSTVGGFGLGIRQHAQTINGIHAMPKFRMHPRTKHTAPDRRSPRVFPHPGYEPRNDPDADEQRPANEIRIAHNTGIARSIILLLPFDRNQHFMRTSALAIWAALEVNPPIGGLI
jgi:hypothetical protein